MDGDERADGQQAADALEAYVARLLSDRATEIPKGLEREELQAYLLAAALAGRRPGAADPPAEVRARLTSLLDEALAHRGQMPLPEGRTPRRLTRRQGLTAAAGLAAGALVGVAVDRTVHGLGSPAPAAHQDLVGPNGRWYDIAAETAVPAGAVRRFSAGAVDGYLINEHGRIWALSAICTHMGCHINWAGANRRFECLCHGATFNLYGRPGTGTLVAALPPIQVRVQRGRVYVWGTQAGMWGGQSLT